MCRSTDRLPSVLIKSSHVSGVNRSLSPYANTPAIWKQVTGGVTVIKGRLWTRTNPSVSRYDWKNTVWRCNNKECFGRSLAQSREQLGVYVFFFLAEVFPRRQEAVKLFQRHPAPVVPLCEAGAGVGVWKELLFNLWTLPFTPFQSAKWQRKTWLCVWWRKRRRAGKRRKSSS